MNACLDNNIKDYFSDILPPNMTTANSVLVKLLLMESDYMIVIHYISTVTITSSNLRCHINFYLLHPYDDRSNSINSNAEALSTRSNVTDSTQGVKTSISKECEELDGAGPAPKIEYDMIL